MLDRLKRFFSTEEPEPSENAASNYDFRWLEPGPENPFGIRVLDCRPLTQHVIATTKDAAIAEKYLHLRESDGRELIDQPIEGATLVFTLLRFPHNGEPLNGIVYKAPSMDVKWDIYIYDSQFLFARSWTGELCYRAKATIGPEEFHITEIECKYEDREIAPAHVYFLMGTHAMRRILPHQLPKDTPANPLAMATLSFNLFGNLGSYATFEDITKVSISRPRS